MDIDFCASMSKSCGGYYLPDLGETAKQVIPAELVINNETMNKMAAIEKKFKLKVL